MCNRVYNHLGSKGPSYEKQFGLQINNSNEHTRLTRDITSTFEKGRYTFGIFIDLFKASDIVDHQILIKSLQYYGTDGIVL